MSATNRVLLAFSTGVLLCFIAIEITNRSSFSVPPFAELAAYAAGWIPLTFVVVLLAASTGFRSFPSKIGLNFRPIDLLWGVAVALLARVVSGVVEIIATGHLFGGSATLGTPVHDSLWVIGAILAPVIISPVVEEVFFRGLLLFALKTATSRRRSFTVGTIVVSSLAFAALHLTQSPSTSYSAHIAVITLLFALVLSALTTLTGRLGGAIVAHVVFNALVILPALS